MPAIPDPARILAPEPTAVETTHDAWNHGASKPPGDLLAVPPFDQWPVFAQKPERVWPVRKDGETERMHAASCYSYAMHWAAEDTVEQRKAAAREERRAANRDAVARHRAKAKAAYAEGLTGEAAAWQAELKMVNDYVKAVDYQIHNARNNRALAVARREELTKLITEHIAKQAAQGDRK